VVQGDDITLSAGSVTDPDPQTLTYSWTQTGGPSVSLSDPSAANPTFPAGPNGTYTFSVAISDGVNTITRTITVTLSVDQVPTADAGPDQLLVNVAPGTVVTLDGRNSSDPENATLTYTWRQISGPAVVLQNANSATPSFAYPSNRSGALRPAAPLPVGSPQEVLVFGLVVSDGTQSSPEDTTQVTINTNVAPDADAGADRTVIGLTNGDTLTLDGTASSDPEGDALRYTWTVLSGSATLVDPTVSQPTLTYTGSSSDGIDETVEVELVVNDGALDSAADTIVITFQDNRSPIADAGSSQSGINAGERVTLTGAASSDPDGDSLSYRWTQVSGPSVALSDATAVSPTFTAPDVQVATTLTFELVVNDGVEDSPAATVSVAVRPVGSLTIVGLTAGGDTRFSFTSNLSALNGDVITSGGQGQLVATRVVSGQYTVTMADPRESGFALTELSCNTANATTSLSSRQAAISLAPGENAVCTFSAVNSRGAAQDAIEQMQAQRGALLLSNGPSFSRRMDRLSGTGSQPSGIQVAGLQLVDGRHAPVSLSMTDAATSLAVSLSGLTGDQANTGKGSFDVWGELTLAEFDSAGRNGDFSLFYIGADYLISDRILVGVLAQLDVFDAGSQQNVGAASGEGFMVGPYATARLTDTLYADVRVAWGEADNEVNPLGTYVDAFDTSRILFSGSLTGDYDLSDTLTLRPTVEYRSFNETQQAYTDSFGVLIPESELNLNELSFAPMLQTSHRQADGDVWTAFIEAEGIYNFGDTVVGVFDEEFRMRLEGGVSWTSDAGLNVNVNAFIDGFGAEDFEAHGLRFSVSKSFR